MNLNLKLKSCISTNCSKIKFTDTSGLYNSTTNPNGWSNSEVVGNLTTTDLLTGRISMTKYGDSTPNYVFYTKTNSGIDLYPDEATNLFDFTEFDWLGEDNIYGIVYAGTTNSPDTITSFTDTILVTCKTEKCIETLWKKYNKTGSKEDMEKAQLAEGLLSGAKYSFYCNKTQNSKNILSILTKICDLANNDCGCN
jgi:hypothetical protein